MKLAELLIERSEMKKRIEVISSRLRRTAKVQEGDPITIPPDKMLTKLDYLIDRHELIIRKINHVNQSTMFEKDMTLADAVVKRESMKHRRNIYSALFSASYIEENRYSKSEIKFVATLNVDKIMEISDDLSRDIRLLDGKIQAKNWEVEVGEI